MRAYYHRRARAVQARCSASLWRCAVPRAAERSHAPRAAPPRPQEANELYRQQRKLDSFRAERRAQA